MSWEVKDIPLIPRRLDQEELYELLSAILMRMPISSKISSLAANTSKQFFKDFKKDIIYYLTVYTVDAGLMEKRKNCKACLENKDDPSCIEHEHQGGGDIYFIVRIEDNLYSFLDELHKYNLGVADRNQIEKIVFADDIELIYVNRENSKNTDSRALYRYDFNCILEEINKDYKRKKKKLNLDIQYNYPKKIDGCNELWSCTNFLERRIAMSNSKKSGIEERYFLFDNQMPLLHRFYIEDKLVSARDFKLAAASEVMKGTSLIFNLARIVISMLMFVKD